MQTLTIAMIVTMMMVMAMIMIRVKAESPVEEILGRVARYNYDDYDESKSRITCRRNTQEGCQV